MKFRKLILGGAFVLALTASFAFKAKDDSYVVCSIKNPENPLQCVTLLLTDDDCAATNTGEQCTSYYNSTYPDVPAYANAGINSCQHPLFHEF